ARKLQMLCVLVGNNQQNGVAYLDRSAKRRVRNLDLPDVNAGIADQSLQTVSNRLGAIMGRKTSNSFVNAEDLAAVDINGIAILGFNCGRFLRLGRIRTGGEAKRKEQTSQKHSDGPS